MIGIDSAAAQSLAGMSSAWLLLLLDAMLKGTVMLVAACSTAARRPKAGAAAAAAAGVCPSEYARHLLQIASSLRADRLSACAAITMARPSRLETRLRAILDPARNRGGVSRFLMLVLAAAVAVTAVLLAMLHPGPQSAQAAAGPPTQSSAGPSSDADQPAATHAQQKQAQTFIGLLKEHRFEQAAALFHPSLREKFPAKELKRIWDEYEREQRAGPFQGAISYEHQSFSGIRMLAVRCRWQKAVMVVRLVFDEHGHIAGFWLARDREGPTPEHFRRGGYAFGPQVEPLARQAAKKPGEGKLAIDVRILGVDGQPIDQPSAVTIWKQVETAAEAELPGYAVTDPRNGTIWRRVGGSIAGESGPARNGKPRFLSRSTLAPGIYRVTAFAGSRKEKMLGMATSEPIHLDGSQKITQVTISIEDGPAAEFLVLDAATGKLIDYPRPGIRLTRSDGLDVEYNPLNGNLFPGDDGRYRIEHLAPGSYRVEVSARTWAYGYPDYELAQPMTIQVGSGPMRQIVLNLQPKPVDEEEAAKRWPWAVEGTVTDGQGRPLEGVEIRAACGWGTLRVTRPVLTDEQGRYRLRFGPGMMIKNEKTGKWGAGVQAAIISARKPGWVEKNLGRQGDLLMADTLPEDPSRWDRSKIILPGKSYRVDFTMVPAAAIAGQLLDENGAAMAKKRIYLNGNVLRPASGVDGSATTDAEGRFHFEAVVPGFARWLQLSDAEEIALPRTQPFTLEQGQEYQMVLRVVAQNDSEKMLRITSLTDSQGRDVLQEVLGDDPRARPFVDEQTAAQARAILDRVAEVNQYWFRALSDDVKSFSYTFHLAGEQPREITYDDYLQAKSWYREWYPKGISYTGGARVLVSLRKRAKFRQVETGPDQITVYFVLDQLPSKVAAGNGIAGTWRGFFSTMMTEGVLKLDTKRLTPISIQYGHVHEQYSHYIEVAPGCYVPGRIQIGPGMRFDFRFRVYRPNMWLFDRSVRRSGEGEEEPVAWVTDVVVNGRPAVSQRNTNDTSEQTGER